MTASMPIDDGHIDLSLAEIAAWQGHKLLQPMSLMGSSPRRQVVASLPALQRGAVWKQVQVELLWDSLLRGLPIGGLVLSPVIVNQEVGKTGAHAGKSGVNGLVEPTHHLLDGQQRADAIALGFYDPFKPGLDTQDLETPILWLDIARPPSNSTRHFLFRLTTIAHPWGFDNKGESKPLTAKGMRDALEDFGWRKDDQSIKPIISITPFDGWPREAEAPIPFAWLVQAAADDDTTPSSLRKRLSDRCVAAEISQHARGVRASWCPPAMAEFSRKSDFLDRVVEAVRKALQRKVIAFVVPPETLALELSGDLQDIATVEQIFLRLNTSGTVPSQEDLSYSLIKAYWPEVEQPIRSIKPERIPASRLFVLGARLALCAPRGSQQENVDSLRRTLTLAEIRKLGQEKEEDGAASIKLFFTADATSTAVPVSLNRIMGQVTKWLEADGHGLPKMLHSSIANGSPEIYLLLMWLAHRWISEAPTPRADISRAVIGIATTLHWFRPNDPAFASNLIAERIDAQDLSDPKLFTAILLDLKKGKRDAGFTAPLRPENFMSMVGDIPDQQALENWAWWKCGRKELSVETDESRAIRAVHSQRELLMFAQREYANSFAFDPTHARSEQHDRPWDFDHILPQSKTKGKWKVPSGLKQWVSSIANMRLCPREENRSDQADCPNTKILNDDDCNRSFLTPAEREAYDACCVDIRDPAAVQAFVNSAKDRLGRIYLEWWDTLEIDYLFNPTE